MAKAFYIENDNGEFYSEDRKKRFICLTGHALKQYLDSPEGKKKRFYVEDDIGVEVPEDKNKIFRRWERRKQYVAETQEQFPYYCVSMSMQSGDGENELSGEEIIADEAVDIQEIAIGNIMTEQLREALLSLNEDEKQLIQALFLDEPPMLQKEYGRKLNMSQQAVSKRISSVLTRLKELLEK